MSKGVEDFSDVSPSAALRAGQLVGGRYEILKCIGRGGMGLVYLVKQIYLGKELALKTIKKSSVSDLTIRRFQQEARASFALDHPSIVTVNDFGLLEDNTPFLVMELLKGKSLSEHLKEKGQLSIEEALPIFIQTCLGLAYAHERGIVHRDIKPGNIMLISEMQLGSEGSVKVVDFGIAKIMDMEGDQAQALTQTGEIFGSPLYMSPEQCAGLKVDYRSDIYSLGCVFFEALSGCPPFYGENAISTLFKHQSEQAPSLKEASLGGDFPEALEEIVRHMLAKLPDDRYQSLDLLANDLRALNGREPAYNRTSHKKKTEEKGSAVSMRAERFYGLISLVAVLAGSLGYMFHVSPSQDETPKPVLIRKQPEVKLLGVERQHTDETDIPAISQKDLRETLKQQKIRGSLLELRNRKLSDAVFKTIVQEPWIETLSLADCEIEQPESLKRLANTRISKVRLSNSNVDDSGASALSTCSALKELKLRGTQITDRGAADIAQISGLEQIVLDNTEVTDKAIESLAKCRKLTFAKL